MLNQTEVKGHQPSDTCLWMAWCCVVLSAGMSVSEADNAHWNQSHSWHSWVNATGWLYNLPVWCMSSIARISCNIESTVNVNIFKCSVYAQMISPSHMGSGRAALSVRDPGFGPTPSAIPTAPCFLPAVKFLRVWMFTVSWLLAF